MPSLRSRLVRQWIRFVIKRRLNGDYPIEKLRRLTDGLTRYVWFPPKARREIREMAGLPAAVFSPVESEPRFTLLYLHGGGYNFGSITMYSDLAGRLAEACQATVILPEYRLAPEHPFPAALDDARSVYQAVHDDPADQPIVVAGDSAGGGLALALAMLLRDHGEPLPARLVCISPWVDLTNSGETISTLEDIEPMLAPVSLDIYARRYAGSHDFDDPRISPLRGDLAGLPPLLIQVGTDEILLSDSQRFAERARSAGVDVTLEVQDRMWHVWHLFAAAVPEARESIKRIADYLQSLDESVATEEREPAMERR